MGYGTGAYTWSAADWARFPAASHCVIDITGSNPTADVLDIENGAATPAQAPAWTRAHAKSSGFPAILYVNRSNQPTVEDVMTAAGLGLGHDYVWWVATLDGTETLPDMTGVWGVQYEGAAQTGGHFDQSIIYDDAWKPPPPPVMHYAAPAPPGRWLDATLTGRGTDERLYRTDYDAHTGVWSAPVEEA